MKNFFYILLKPASKQTVEVALMLMRIALGILTMYHGVPKMFGGPSQWRELGTFVNPLGIYFWPVAWGLAGACTEFLGGILLAFGFATRIACFALVIMMFVAFVWHVSRGDSFERYSFPLTLIFIYAAFVIMGGGPYSIDQLLSRGF